MKAGIFLCNGLCRLSYTPEYRRFRTPCSVKQVQTDYLMKLMQNNADTAYGRRYGFGRIRRYEDFAAAVPLAVYEDYLPEIERIGNGEKKVLTAEEVILFELTSGSSSGKKLIPYTASLKKEFLRGIKPWLCDIYAHVDGVGRGRSYWSITPLTEKKAFTPGGIPIGFEEDTEYFGRLGSILLKQLFAVDSSVKYCSDTEEFYRKTALQLLACDDLSLISVWSPSFLNILCGYMEENRDSLCRELAKQGKKKRAFTVAEGLAGGQFQKVFPGLRIISCWADGAAADSVHGVKARFPGVMLQPKGLLATECFVSFPLVGEEGSRLAVYSHFFEFRSLLDGTICRAEDLKEGDYEVIVTTGGGFYRYCIGDVIRVLKIFPDAPALIRFLYRSGGTVDRFGEKMTEKFVRTLRRALDGEGKFFLLAPREGGYCLYTTDRRVTADRLEEALCENFHYRYCRQLNQLKKASVAVVGGNPDQAYLDRLSSEHMRIGDIKPALLSAKSGWENWFAVEEYRE